MSKRSLTIVLFEDNHYDAEEISSFLRESGHEVLVYSTLQAICKKFNELTQSGTHEFSTIPERYMEFHEPIEPRTGEVYDVLIADDAWGSDSPFNCWNIIKVLKQKYPRRTHIITSQHFIPTVRILYNDPSFNASDAVFEKELLGYKQRIRDCIEKIA